MPANPPATRARFGLPARSLIAAVLLATLALSPTGGWAQDAANSASAPEHARIAKSLDALVEAARKAGGVVGVAVVDLETGDVVVDNRGTTPHDPASNMKLLTAWAALTDLGPQHRFLTALRGTIAGDRVASLTLAGDGDPSLEVRHLQEMVARLQRAGVRVVGDILVDQSRFDGVYEPPAFGSQPNEWAAFRAPVAAVSLAGNTVMMEVRPATESGKAAKVGFVPASFVGVTGRVKTADANRPEAVQLSLAPNGSRLSATVGGSLPAGSPTLRIYRRVDDPTLLAGYALADVCRQFGMRVEGEVRAGRKRKAPLLSAHRSEPIAKLLHALGKHSNNFYAEMVFKSLSAAPGPASFAASARRLEALLDEAGLDRRGASFRNGSGLFDAGRISPLMTARLLRVARRDPAVAPEMLAQLSIGGVDGTLRRRFRKHAKSRRIRGKTGTLAAVSALSGYVLGPGDRGYAFSIMANDVRGKAVRMRKAIDAFVESLAREHP
jgi:serine-type D-Ala-D-Ala carboxypeptidase/endopeptidase (penicillin-binding protein 4)